MMTIHHSDIRNLHTALNGTPDCWSRIVTNFHEMTDVWRNLSSENLKGVVTIEDNSQKMLCVDASALSKKFTIELTPLIIQTRQYGRIAIRTTHPLKEERIEVASILVNRRAEFFNTDETPLADINNHNDNYFMLLGNITLEVLSQ